MFKKSSYGTYFNGFYGCTKFVFCDSIANGEIKFYYYHKCGKMNFRPIAFHREKCLLYIFCGRRSVHCRFGDFVIDRIEVTFRLAINN